MKIREILSIINSLGYPGVMKAIDSIQNSIFQWKFGVNFDTLNAERKNYIKAVGKIKPEAIKKAETRLYELRAQKKGDEQQELAKTNELEKLKKQIDTFYASEQIIQLLEADVDINIRKVNINDLPPDLNGVVKTIMWMIETDE